MNDTLTDNKGGWIRRDSANAYTLNITEQHVCGLSGFGYGPDDSCPACEQGRTLRAMMKKAEGWHKPIKLDVSPEWCERMANLEDGCEITAGGELELSEVVFKAQTQWTKDWPTDEGWYWFYGTRWNRDGSPNGESDTTKKLHVVKVVIAANDIAIHLCQGVPIYKFEGAKGVWTPVQMPDLPK